MKYDINLDYLEASIISIILKNNIIAGVIVENNNKRILFESSDFDKLFDKYIIDNAEYDYETGKLLIDKNIKSGLTKISINEIIIKKLAAFTAQEVENYKGNYDIFCKSRGPKLSIKIYKNNRYIKLTLDINKSEVEIERVNTIDSIKFFHKYPDYYSTSVKNLHYWKRTIRELIKYSYEEVDNDIDFKSSNLFVSKYLNVLKQENWIKNEYKPKNKKSNSKISLNNIFDSVTDGG